MLEYLGHSNSWSMNTAVFSPLIMGIMALCLISQGAWADSYGEKAQEHLKYISGEIGGRYPGSQAEEETGEYIFTRFTQYGYTPTIQSFSFTDEDGLMQRSKNIIAVKEGQSPDSVIIGAHYDSMDKGRGADDNGSGIAVLLELAERMSVLNTSHSIIFAAFGAEENELDGSRHFVQNLDLKDRDFLIGFINPDGIIAGNELYLYADTDTRLYHLVGSTPQISAFTFLPSEYLEDEDGSPCDCADVSPFQEEGIPFLFIEATDYSQGEEDGWTQVDPRYGDEGVIRHTSYDTIPYINSSFPGRIEERLSTVVSFVMESFTSSE